MSNGGGGLWEEVILDQTVKDRYEAEERALGRLRQKSFEYLRAEGSGEGNPPLMAGATVMMKQVGKVYSGEYIAEWVVHRFDRWEGYITEFALKRNMVDEAARAALDRPGKPSGKKRRRKKGLSFASSMEEGRGGDTREALVDDEVTLSFEAPVQV